MYDYFYNMHDSPWLLLKTTDDLVIVEHPDNRLPFGPCRLIWENVTFIQMFSQVHSN
jgi:hypothetical protein